MACAYCTAGDTSCPVCRPRTRPEQVFWVDETACGYGVFYRKDGRTLCVHGTANSDRVVSENCAKALNDLFFERACCRQSDV